MRLQVGCWQNSLGLVVYPIPASGGGAERRRRCRSAPRDSRVAARSHKRVETERINRRPPRSPFKRSGRCNPVHCNHHSITMYMLTYKCTCIVFLTLVLCSFGIGRMGRKTKTAAASSLTLPKLSTGESTPSTTGERSRTISPLLSLRTGQREGS